MQVLSGLDYILQDDLRKGKNGKWYRKILEKYSDNTEKIRFQYFSECGTWQFSNYENINDFKRKESLT